MMVFVSPLWGIMQSLFLIVTSVYFLELDLGLDDRFYACALQFLPEIKIILIDATRATAVYFFPKRPLLQLQKFSANSKILQG